MSNPSDNSAPPEPAQPPPGAANGTPTADPRPRQRAPRRHFVAALAVVALGLLVVFPVEASANLLTPESGGSPNADDIAGLYRVLLAVAAVVFVGVEGALVYALVKFRARKGAIAVQIRGNTRLEIAWTVGAAVVLVALAAVTFSKLAAIRNPPNSSPTGLRLRQGVIVAPSSGGGVARRVPPDGKSLNICVNGQQYIWRYTYTPDCTNAPLGATYSYTRMVVPTDTTVTLDINSTDVAHSWWVPSLGGKFDAVPGHTNYTWFKIPRRLAGRRLQGQCAELCGRNHANMVTSVEPVSPARFEAWLARQKSDIAAANKAVAAQPKPPAGR